MTNELGVRKNNKIRIIIGITGFLLSLLFPVLAWLIETYHYHIDFTFSSILKLHQLNKLNYLIDALPLLVGFTALTIGLYITENIKLLKTKIQKQEKSISKVRMFAEKIGEGELDVEYESGNGHDAIGGALLKMRDNLRKSAQNEQDRQWTMEGVAKLSDILMAYTDLEELGYHVIVFLVQKIRAIQGAFYLIEEDEEKKAIIKMTACYAYNRKKYLNREFKIGEGLVGQAAIERAFIYRTEIPNNYATITSGILGDKKPNSLLIVPLIANETLHGVVEFASLNNIKQIEIDFVNEAAKIIGQTIFNVGVNAKTAKLLDEVSRSQKRMQVLLENASEIISIYDENRRVRYESPSVTKILGYTPEEIIGDADFSRVHPKGLATIHKMFDELLANPLTPRTIEISYNKKNGERIWLETIGRNLLHDPAIRGIILNSRDVTMKRKALKEEKKRGQMQALSENSLDLIIRLDKKGTFYYINPVIEKFSGNKPNSFLQKNIHEVELDNDFIALLNKIVREVPSSKQKFNTEINYTIKSNSVVENKKKQQPKILNVNAMPEFNEDTGDVETILIVAHDITETKLNEQKIQETNKKITESINYAEKIQKAMLPQEKHLIQSFSDSFMLYEPRDVVSGDFPWIYEQDNIIYIAIVDCTGHGVPGAFMALIGNFLLNQIVNGYELLSPAQILDFLHEGVKKTLKQEENTETRDGMDIGLCKINLKNNQLEYAGAHRPLYIIRKAELIEPVIELVEIKGDKYPIGGIQYKNRKTFTNNLFNLEAGDAFYLFSDGLPDQIGGAEGKKFMTTKIKEVIFANNQKSMQEICAVMKTAYYDWKNGYKQIDDVLMLGVRI